MAEARPIERLLRRDRLISAGALAILCVAAWAYILAGAGMSPPAAGSSMGDMAGMAGVGAPAAERSALAEPWEFLLGVLMWWSMMIAMMAPAAAPMVLLYARVARTSRNAAEGPVLAHTGGFVVGYLAAWLMFSLVATLLQHGLTRMTWLSPTDMSVRNAWFDAGVLILAGIYQLSPLQDVCLNHCRSPAAFLAQNYRPGVVGALRLGELHGVYCIGCCWLLMTVLFVVGVMNLAWIAALAVLVAAEKMLPGGRWIGRIAGVGLIAWGVARLM